MKKYFLTILFALILSRNSVANITYINDQTCASCHQAEYQQWQNSHHALAMQVATNKTVLANFNNFKLNYAAHTILFYIKNNIYFIEMTGPGDQIQNYKVVYTFGVDPLQQYLVQFPNGKLQVFPIAWDTKQKKWFHLNPAENMDPDNSLYWGKRYFNWNFSCADCHSTNIHKNYNEATDNYLTTWSAINVGCQACHGPGNNHLKWAQAKLKGKTITIANEGLINNYSTMSSKQYVEACAFCHSRRHPIIDVPITGTPLLDNYVPALLRENIYFADGSIEDEDFEYGSFIQSKMYKSGVICSDCHNPHTALVKVNNNSLCTQCHNTNPPLQRFPTLIAKNYDTPTHTHHPINSLASECVSCHMPTRTYMNIDVRRDHYFRIPRPDLTIKYGIPNACNSCHKDKSPQWAQQAIEKWYGKINSNDDYADIITAGRKFLPQAENQLIH